MELSYRCAGTGPPVLLIHGGGEDAGMLDGLGHALAERGRRTIWYDRRGTGASTRENWPRGGAAQHADDVAMLLREAGAPDATVVGFSSGAVVALAFAARHPSTAAEVVAWEPAALGMLPNGKELYAAITAPIDAYLAEHPGDWAGAFHVALDVLSEGRADHSAPQVKLLEANAEAMLRDDSPHLTTHVFAPGDLPADVVTVAVGAQPSPLHAAMADAVGELLGKPPVVVAEADDHEIYLLRPEVMADFLAARPVARG